MTQPDHEVYARLRSSPVHGVGVFAIRFIPKDARIFAGDSSSIVWVDEKVAQSKPQEIQQLFHDFCIRRNGKLGCPKNFNAMTLSWYVNHSERPNVYIDKSFDFFAVRDIVPGEELVTDYRTYND